jgi:hypothetical protein
VEGLNRIKRMNSATEKTFSAIGKTFSAGEKILPLFLTQRVSHARTVEIHHTFRFASHVAAVIASVLQNLFGLLRWFGGVEREECPKLVRILSGDHFLPSFSSFIAGSDPLYLAEPKHEFEVAAFGECRRVPAGWKGPDLYVPEFVVAAYDFENGCDRFGVSDRFGDLKRVLVPVHVHLVDYVDPVNVMCFGNRDRSRAAHHEYADRRHDKGVEN